MGLLKEQGPAPASPDAGGTKPEGSQGEGNQGEGGNPPAGGEQNPPVTAKYASQLKTEYRDPRLPEDINELASGYLDYLGKADRLVELPGEEASEEQRAAYRKAMGIPEKPDDYQFEPKSDLPEGLVYDDDKVAEFRKAAHDLNLSAEQAKGIEEWYMGTEVDSFKGMAAEREKASARALETLKEKLGDDKFKELGNKTNALVKAHFTNEFVEYLDRYGITNDPVFLEGMMSIANAMITSDPGGGGGGDESSSAEATYRKMFPRSYDKMRS